MTEALQLGDGRQWTVWDIHIEPHYLAKPLPSSLQWQPSEGQLAHWHWCDILPIGFAADASHIEGLDVVLRQG